MHKFTDTANADRNTVHTTMNDTLSNTPPREYPVKTYDNLYVQEDFGTLDYPVAVSYLDLSKSYMNRIRWHWHEEMEILIINNGFAEVVTDDASYPLKLGQGIIINQNVMHSIQSMDQKNCTFYSLVFHPDFLFGHKSSYLHTQFLLPIQNYHLFKILVLNETNPWHEHMLDAVNDTIAANVTKQFGYEIATKGYLCHFWSELISKLPKLDTAPPPHVSLDEQRVKQAMLFIRKHHADPISLEEIADSIHISKSECCRCFSRTLQMTPFEYLMRYRILEATKKMIEQIKEPMSIADIALSVGFNNVSYFNKLFKKFLGCTPTYYRTHKIPSGETAQNNGPFSVPVI